MVGRIAKHANIAVAAMTLVAFWEGCQLSAYPDPATKGEPWTICYGETAGVKKGDMRVLEQCKAGLKKGLNNYGDQVEACAKDLTDGAFIAFTSLAWNIGPTAFCKSSAARLWNAGKRKEACDAMLLWNMAAGVPMRGLTRRRTNEREWCLQGI